MLEKSKKEEKNNLVLKLAVFSLAALTITAVIYYLYEETNIFNNNNNRCVEDKWTREDWQGTTEGYTCDLKNIKINSKHEKFQPIAKNYEKYTDMSISNSIIPVLNNEICQKFPNIQNLYLNNIQIEEIDADAFYACNNLLNLELKQNNIKRLDEGLFNSLQNVKKLDLDNNDLTEFSPELLKNMNNLKELYLRSNNLKDLDVEKIIEYVPWIEKIWFDDNLIPQERLTEIANIIDTKIQKPCWFNWFTPFYWENLSKYLDPADELQ